MTTVANRNKLQQYERSTVFTTALFHFTQWYQFTNMVGWSLLNHFQLNCAHSHRHAWELPLRNLYSIHFAQVDKAMRDQTWEPEKWNSMLMYVNPLQILRVQIRLDTAPCVPPNQRGVTVLLWPFPYTLLIRKDRNGSAHALSLSWRTGFGKDTHALDLSTYCHYPKDKCVGQWPYLVHVHKVWISCPYRHEDMPGLASHY